MTLFEERIKQIYGDNYVNIIKLMASAHTQAELIRQLAEETGMTIGRPLMRKILNKHNIKTAKPKRKKMEYEDLLLKNKDKMPRKLLKILKGDGAFPEDWPVTYRALKYTRARLLKKGMI